MKKELEKSLLLLVFEIETRITKPSPHNTLRFSETTHTASENYSPRSSSVTHLLYHYFLSFHQHLYLLTPTRTSHHRTQLSSLPSSRTSVLSIFPFIHSRYAPINIALTYLPRLLHPLDDHLHSSSSSQLNQRHNQQVESNAIKREIEGGGSVCNPEFRLESRGRGDGRRCHTPWILLAIEGGSPGGGARRTMVGFSI